MLKITYIQTEITVIHLNQTEGKHVSVCKKWQVEPYSDFWKSEQAFDMQFGEGGQEEACGLTECACVWERGWCGVRCKSYTREQGGDEKRQNR